MVGKCLSYVFDQSSLVLEGVTLAQLVELVIEMLVNLASSTVLDEKTSEHAEASHPEDLAAIQRISTIFLLYQPTLSCVIDSIIVPRHSRI